MAEIITSIDELKARLKEIERALDDRAKRAAWADMSLSPEVLAELRAPIEGLDPFSDAYKDAVLATYQRLQGGTYDVGNEVTADANVQGLIDLPLPFCLRNPALVGRFLIAYGQIVAEIGDLFGHLDRPIKVLEVGSGQGALSQYMAGAGIEVTCLDINPDFIRICEGVTGRFGPKCTGIVSDMETFETDERFDVVIFFESLHHSLHHREVIARYREMLAPGGVMMFGAEPVTESIPTVSEPWGLRFDLESLRAIILFGWLELGFHQDYFAEVLRRAGLSVRYTAQPGSPWSELWIATPGATAEASEPVADAGPVPARPPDQRSDLRKAGARLLPEALKAPLRRLLR